MVTRRAQNRSRMTLALFAAAVVAAGQMTHRAGGSAPVPALQSATAPSKAGRTSARTAASQPAKPAPPKDAGPGFITFAVNVHDTRHIKESADTIVRLVE